MLHHIFSFFHSFNMFGKISELKPGPNGSSHPPQIKGKVIDISPLLETQRGSRWFTFMLQGTDSATIQCFCWDDAELLYPKFRSNVFYRLSGFGIKAVTQYCRKTGHSYSLLITKSTKTQELKHAYFEENGVEFVCDDKRKKKNTIKTIKQPTITNYFRPK